MSGQWLCAQCTALCPVNGWSVCDVDIDSTVSSDSVLEGIFRSLNNLLEKLHHSEFYYLTPAHDTFLSLGRYLPPLGLLLAPMILEVFVVTKKRWSWSVPARWKLFFCSASDYGLMAGMERVVILTCTRWYVRGMMLKSLAYDCMHPFSSGYSSSGFPAPEPCAVAADVLAGKRYAAFDLPTASVLVQWIPLTWWAAFCYSHPLCPAFAYSTDPQVSVMMCPNQQLHYQPYPCRLSLTTEEWQLSKSLLLLATIIGLFGLSLMNFPLSLLVTLSCSLPFSLSTAWSKWSVSTCLCGWC